MRVNDNDNENDNENEDENSLPEAIHQQSTINHHPSTLNLQPASQLSIVPCQLSIGIVNSLLQIQFEHLLQLLQCRIALFELLILFHTAIDMMHLLSLLKHHLHGDTAVLHLLLQI